MEHPGILLFIDELHTIIGAGGAEGALDASNILNLLFREERSRLSVRPRLKNTENISKKDAALERRFQPVTVEEPTQEQAVEILKGLRPYYENITESPLPMRRWRQQSRCLSVILQTGICRTKPLI